MNPKTTADPLAEFKSLVIGHAIGCSVGETIKKLSPEDSKALNLALDQPSSEIQHAVISRWLSTRGHKISAHTVGRHRSDECSCSRVDD